MSFQPIAWIDLGWLSQAHIYLLIFKYLWVGVYILHEDEHIVGCYSWMSYSTGSGKKNSRCKKRFAFIDLLCDKNKYSKFSPIESD